MKKLMIALCVLTLGFSASAQYNPSFRFGLKAGTNLSNINGSNDLSLNSGNTAFNFQDNSNRSTGFAGGVFFRFGRAFYIQPEILLSQKGGQFNVYKDAIKNEDGKIELAFDDKRKLILVDVLGTLDECRFTYGGVHVSKEVARQFYKKTSWYTDLEQAKKDAEAKGIQDWKSLCKSQPPKLDLKLKTVISQMYMAVANEMSGKKLFDTPKLAKVIDSYKEYMGEKA